MIERLKEHCIFSEDDPYRVYILMSVSRPKNNKGKGITANKDTQAINKYVIKSESNIIKYYDKIKRLCESDDLSHYIYVSVNPRDTRKAFMKLQERMLDWSNDLICGRQNATPKLRRIDKEWISTLCKPNCRHPSSKTFMIDVDYDEIPGKLWTILNSNDVNIFKEYKTKNGWHILAKAFDSRLIEDLKDPNISIKKDGELFIESIEK